MPKITGGVVRDMLIPLSPEKELAVALSTIAQDWMTTKDVESELASILHSSRELRQSILHAAFPGRLVPQAPADEPAATLLARLRALLRRHIPRETNEGVLRFDDLTVNQATREVTRGERSIALTRIEFDLLELFMTHPRQVLTRDQILDLVWGYQFDSTTNSLAVYIGYLRRKLEENNEPRLLQTVRGVGYALRTA